MTGRIMVAGVGNVLRRDDGFGVEVVRRLAGQPLPAGVEVVDVGIRGVHLAYQLLDGYRALVLVDTTARGGHPGQLYLLEHDLSAEPDPDGVTVPDAHGMSPDAVLALLGSLAAALGAEPADGPGAGLRRTVGRVLVVGCEPACLAEGIGLTEPVAAAVDRAADLVLEVLAELGPPVTERTVTGRAVTGQATRRT